MTELTVDDAPMPRWVRRAIVLWWGIFVGIFVGYWLVQRLRSLLVMLLVSVFLSFAMEPAVHWLEKKGIRRSFGTLLTFLTTTVGLGLFTYSIGAVLADQVSTLIGEIPDYIVQIENLARDQFGWELDTDELLSEFNEGGRASQIATDLAGNLFEISTRVLNALFQFLTISLFTFYLLADGPRVRRSICSRFTPDRQSEILRGWDLAVEKTGGYIYSRAVLAGMSALVHWITFVIIGLPFPAPLGLWVGVISQFVPVVGTYIAGVVPLLIAVLDKPINALWVLVIVFVYQQIENYLVAPRITAQTLEIHPAVAFGAVIAGASVLGAIGALLALPVAATSQAFLSTYFGRHELIDEIDQPELRRARRRDRPTPLSGGEESPSD
ncbi:MAG: AI-2E family transporter [Actinomycetia bacterium]|nr:AI-2E family transporter [Actinomycetes bacterium]